MTQFLWLAAVFLTVLAGRLDAISRFSLSGTNWKLQQEGHEELIDAVVPGNVYTDLQRAGVIDDPYYRFNDLKYRWVAYNNWTYSTTVFFNESLSKYGNIRLLVGGLQTVAVISVNGHVVGNTDNMFRRYVLDIASSLRSGTNDLSIKFQSPVYYAGNQSKTYPYDVPPDCPDAAQKGECHVNFLRTEACSFSWDWGPAFPTMGIWRNLEVEAFYVAAIRYIVTDTIKDGDDWILTVGAFFEVKPKGGMTSLTGKLEIKILEVDTKFNWSGNVVLMEGDDSKAQVSITIPKSVGMEAWWPNGHGKSTLYTLSVALLSSDTDEAVIDSREVHVGFRTVQLVQDPIVGASGLTFYFKINGEPIFMKGSNWIPADSFQERITKDYLRYLLTSAKLANINMLRVWGGGVYESEDFYELADELGIMLWHDFMFACALYPSNPAFLDNVREEIRHQVRRLSRHPSIAIWAGNNENEGRISVYHRKPSYLQYYKDYVSLYVNTILAVVNEEDPRGRPFVPSSPSDGLNTVAQGWVAENSQDTHYGDVHHYDYSCDSWNWTVYPIPRFASEFGFQSWCSLETLMNVSEPEDWDEKSNFSSHRQHHPDGNSQLEREYRMHFLPPNATDPKQRFSDYIYLTQINQAMGIRTESELYRRMQSSTDKNGQGLTMGALYWQLNDIWQAPTWASIEYGGKWKMLHYFAKNFFDRVLVSPVIDGQNLQVYFIYETPASKRSETMKSTVRHKSVDVRQWDVSGNVVHMEQEGAGTTFFEVIVSMYSWDNPRPLKQWTQKFDKPQNVSTLVYEHNLSKLLTESGCVSVKHCFIKTTVNVVDSGEYLSRVNWLPLSNFTDAVGLKKAKIEVPIILPEGGFRIQLSLKTDVIAPFVWLEAWGQEGYFSDNGFLLFPGTHFLFNVYFYPRNYSAIDLEQFKKNLKVKSLMDIY